MELLKQPEPVILTTKQKEKYEISRKYFDENVYSYFFFYRYFSFFFKKKIKEFFEKSDFYFEIRDKQRAVFKYKIAQALANDEYEQNGFGHYIFNIDGESHTYGVMEIDDKIFYTAQILKYNRERQVERNNVVQLFKNK